MHSKFRKALLAGAMTAMAFAGTSSAAQAAWTSNGPLTGVNASGGTTTLSIAASGGTVGVTCTSSSASGGNLAGPSGPATGTNWDVLTNLSLTFNTCTAAGFAANVTCTGTSTLTAQSETSGVVSGFIKGVSCQIKTPSFPSCTINVVGTGASGKAVNGTYTNSTGVLAISAAGQTLTATWTGCPFINPTSGNAPATFNGTYTVTSSPKPVLTD